MTTRAATSRGPRKARAAFVALLSAAGFLAIGAADAAPPNENGVSSSHGKATYSNGAPSYSAPVPSKGTGRKVG